MNEGSLGKWLWHLNWKKEDVERVDDMRKCFYNPSVVCVRMKQQEE